MSQAVVVVDVFFSPILTKSLDDYKKKKAAQAEENTSFHSKHQIDFSFDFISFA